MNCKMDKPLKKIDRYSSKYFALNTLSSQKVEFGSMNRDWDAALVMIKARHDIGAIERLHLSYINRKSLDLITRNKACLQSYEPG